MKYLTILAVSLSAILFNAGLASSDPTSASTNWFSSTGPQSAFSKNVKDIRAEMIKRAESGYYNGFDTYYTVINSTTIGAQVVFSDSYIIANSINATSCGNLSSQNQIDTLGNNSNSTEGSITCTMNGSDE